MAFLECNNFFGTEEVGTGASHRSTFCRRWDSGARPRGNWRWDHLGKNPIRRQSQSGYPALVTVTILNG